MEPATPRSPARLAGRTLLSTQSDKRLVVLARQGSEPAFEAIVERYRGSLRRYCRQISPRSRVDDVLQHTFLSAYHALTTDPRDLDLRSWLFRVAHNAALDALRREAWSSEQLDESYDGVEAPDLALERKESLRTLLSNLSDLPERQRTALVLREMEGRSWEEISQELGVTRGAVRQLLYRARCSLRAAASWIVPPSLLLPREPNGDRSAVAERIVELASGAGAGASLAKATAVVALTGAMGAATISIGQNDAPVGAGGSGGVGVFRDADSNGGPAGTIQDGGESTRRWALHAGGGGGPEVDGAVRSPGGSRRGLQDIEVTGAGAGARGLGAPVVEPHDDAGGPVDGGGPGYDDGSGGGGLGDDYGPGGGGSGDDDDDAIVPAVTGGTVRDDDFGEELTPFGSHTADSDDDLGSDDDDSDSDDDDEDDTAN